MFVVRAWWEDGSFRARVTHRADVRHGVEATIVTADTAEVVRQLQLWIDGLGEPR